jgi:hypothetical protein
MRRRSAHLPGPGPVAPTAHGIAGGALIGGTRGSRAFVQCQRDGDTIVCLRQDGSELSIRRPRSRGRYGTWRRQRT